jgi:predicted nucleic-acid-binding Zn-ribbon protein
MLAKSRPARCRQFLTLISQISKDITRKTVMAKGEECEFFANGQCKALVKEGAMSRDELCLNANRSSCCYQCSRKDSCEISCDYLDDPRTYADAETTDISNKPILHQARTLASEAGDCPKCGGEMIQGMTTNYVRILKPGDLSGDLVATFYCRECGFVEFYKKPSSKEPWRWQRHQEGQSQESEQTPKEDESSAETSRRKMVR